MESMLSPITALLTAIAQVLVAVAGILLAKAKLEEVRAGQGGKPPVRKHTQRRIKTRRQN
jgi:hypothetical protein